MIRDPDAVGLARDAKRENAMCAVGTCTASHNLREAPDGYTGQSGGTMLCPDHYDAVVDNLRDHLDEHGCAPWDDE